LIIIDPNSCFRIFWAFASLFLLQPFWFRVFANNGKFGTICWNYFSLLWYRASLSNKQWRKPNYLQIITLALNSMMTPIFFLFYVACGWWEKCWLRQKELIEGKDWSVQQPRRDWTSKILCMDLCSVQCAFVQCAGCRVQGARCIAHCHSLWPTLGPF